MGLGRLGVGGGVRVRVRVREWVGVRVRVKKDDSEMHKRKLCDEDKHKNMFPLSLSIDQATQPVQS